jgi:YD repeat-containing protein
VAGTVSEPAAVTIEGQPARVDGANGFRGTAAVPPGTTTFAVTATDASGNSQTNAYEFDVTAASDTLTYDANGNLTAQGTKTYEWNARNELVRVLEGATVLASFAYDGFGRRAEKTVGVATRRFVYAGEDIVEERVGATTSRHIHGPGIDQPLATVTGSDVAYYLADHLGSIVQTTDPSAAVSLTRRYDPFGRLLEGQASSGYGFTGREWDAEIGLYYYRARYYDPQIGRFIEILSNVVDRCVS